MVGARPVGYRRNPDSGLIVPADLSRKREVWTRNEGKLLDRALALLKSRRVKLLLQCGNPKCFAPGLERIVGPTGEVILRCDCTERVFSRTL